MIVVKKKYAYEYTMQEWEGLKVRDKARHEFLTGGDPAGPDYHHAECMAALAQGRAVSERVIDSYSFDPVARGQLLRAQKDAELRRKG